MPEKSVREMTPRERKRHSLAAKTFRSALMGSVILGLVAFAIGLGLYTYALVKHYTAQAFSISRSAAAILEKTADVEPLADSVMAAYRDQTEQERSETGTEAYRARFSSFTEREDFEAVCSVLADFNDSNDVDDVYLAMYDPETCAMVYIVDPDHDPETRVMPADWDPVTREGMERFLRWDGEGLLYEIERTENYGWLCTSGVPIRNGQGEPAAFVLTDLSLANIGHGMRDFLLQYLVGLGIATLLWGYFLTRNMKKSLIRPLNDIAQAAETYVKDRRSGSDNTDHFSRDALGVTTGDEVENLSLVMADMERDLIEHEANLTRITAEKERIGTELALATRIQAAMLPHIFPAFPDRSEFDIYATMEPAKEVGGDFYDFFLIDGDHLCMIIADVSGKGIPAALMMMASKIILDSCAMLGSNSAAEILTRTNEAICSNNREEMFVTVWLGILEISTGRLTAANAGHEYPVLQQSGGGFALYRDRHGFVIGGMEGSRYRDYEIRLSPGDKLFVYTDGVAEAADENDRMFGTDRLLDALNAAPEASAKQLVSNVRRAVDGFVREAPQFDDLTMLCLEYYGPAGGAGEAGQGP